MKQIARNFLVGFAIGSLGLFAWTGTAIQASSPSPTVNTAAN